MLAQETPGVAQLEERRRRLVRTRQLVPRTRQLVVPRKKLPEPPASPLAMIPLERQQVLVPHKRQQAQRRRLAVVPR